jgi:hypothetical protein
MPQAAIMGVTKADRAKKRTAWRQDGVKVCNLYAVLDPRAHYIKMPAMTCMERILGLWEVKQWEHVIRDSGKSDGGLADDEI